MEIYNSIYNSRPLAFSLPPSPSSPVSHYMQYKQPDYYGYTSNAPNYEVYYQMQNLRFPTPPITPPRSHNEQVTGDDIISESPLVQNHRVGTPKQQQQYQQLRTQSVIMKIGQGDSAQCVPAELSVLDDINEIRKSQTECEQDTIATNSESSTHSNELYICNWIDCGRYFESLELLAAHVNQIHAVASPLDGLYYCRWSGCQRIDRGFNARYKMLVHTRTHTKEKPHQCHLCEKSFSRAENLKIHLRSHSGERPYVCTFEGCTKKYSNSSDRFKHTRTHSMEKPYMCKIPGCQKRYTDPSSLRKHVKTFKHSIQLIDNARMLRENEPRIDDISYTAQSTDCQTTRVNISENRLDLQNDHYYMDCETADHSPIESKHLDKYYLSKTSTYWMDNNGDSTYSDAVIYKNYSIENNTSINALEVDIDIPLDLRINRN